MEFQFSGTVVNRYCHQFTWYSNNLKTLKCEDNFQTEDMTLNGPISSGHSNCTV